MSAAQVFRSFRKTTIEIKTQSSMASHALRFLGLILALLS